MSEANQPPHICRTCGDDIPQARAQAGYKVCLWCGEEQAAQERRSWCVVQEYGKGCYMFVTAASAPTTLKQTNQKATRD